MCIRIEMKGDVSGWRNNVQLACRQICHGPIQIVVYSAVSLMGWGATFNNQEIVIGQTWNNLITFVP